MCVCVCVRVTAEAYFKGVLQLLLSTYVANVWTQCEQVTLPKSHEGDPLDTDSSRDRHETVQTHFAFCILDVLKSRPGNTRTERLIVAGRTMRQERLAQISRADTSST